MTCYMQVNKVRTEIYEIAFSKSLEFEKSNYPVATSNSTQLKVGKALFSGRTLKQKENILVQVYNPQAKQDD